MTEREPPREARLWPRLGARRHLGVALILGSMLVLTYANTLHNTDFVLDNRLLILRDPRLREPTEANLKLIFQQDHLWPNVVSGFYRPLTTLSYLFNYSILQNRDNSTGYHWVNLLAHWVNAILVYLLALALLQNAWQAFFVAAVFGVHPITTESVANIAGRADLFAAGSTLAALLFYVKSTAAPRWRKAPWLIGLMVAATVGVFSKESAVVIVGLMGLYDITYGIRPGHGQRPVNHGASFDTFRLTGYIVLIPTFLAMWYVRSLVFAGARPPVVAFVDNPLVGADFWTARLTAIKVLGKSLWLLVWPQTLSCDYSYDEIPLVSWSFRTLEDWKAIFALVLVVGIILLAVASYRRHKPLFFFIVFFFVALLPTSNLFLIIGSIMAERFLYLSTVGFAGCLVIAAHAGGQRLVRQLRLSERVGASRLQILAGTALTLVVIGYGTRAFTRNFDWEDDRTLWTQAVQAVPNSFKSHFGLAYALYDKDPERKEIDRIIEEGERAVAVMEKRPLPPENQTSVVYLYLGTYYGIKGDTLAERAPDGALLPGARSRLWYQKAADTLAKAVSPDRALNELIRRAERIRGKSDDQIPDVANPNIYQNLGRVYTRLGRHRDALDAYRYMRRLAPTSPDAYLGIASAYRAAGQLDDAAIALVQALLIESGRTDALHEVADVYRRIDRDGCALIQTPSGLKVNIDCPIARRHTCAALMGLAQTFVEARQYQRADQAMRALQTYKCPAAGPFWRLPLPASPSPGEPSGSAFGS